MLRQSDIDMNGQRQPVGDGIKRSSVTFPNDHAPRVFLGRPFGSGATRRPSMASICAWNRRVANGALIAVARLISSTASVANPPSNRPA
jgi:hypothetical protein